VIDSPRIEEAARSGEGFGWHEHVHDVHEGCERFPRSQITDSPSTASTSNTRRKPGS
jgi:hypothetical protein